MSIYFNIIGIRKYVIKKVIYNIGSVVRLLDFHNRSSKIIVQEVSIDDRL